MIIVSLSFISHCATQQNILYLSPNIWLIYCVCRNPTKYVSTMIPGPMNKTIFYELPDPVYVLMPNSQWMYHYFLAKLNLWF